MMTRPMIALCSPRSRRKRRNPGESCRDDVSVESAAAVDPETLITASTAWIDLAIANPRVDEGIDNVDDQVGQDEDDRNHEDHSLNDRVVAVKDGADQDAADATNRKNRLDEDRTAQ